MINDFTVFTAAERTFIKEELKWFRAGSKLFSPSGDDITSRKIVELQARLEHADKAMNGLNEA